ncbi:MAG: helix-turn-helix domain-containing protein [Lentimonas sp.]
MNIYDSYESLIASVYTYNPRGSYGPRVHADLRLVYNYTGTCDVRIDDVWHHVGTGQMIFLLPRTEEEYLYDAKIESRCGWCAVHGPQIRDAAYGSLKQLAPVHEMSERFIQLATMAEELYPANSSGEHGVYYAIIEAMFYEFLRIAGFQENPEPPMHPAVKAGMQFIEKYYSEPMDLAVIAKRAGVSSQHLVRLFKQQLKLSPTELLWQVRCEHAARMLQNTGFNASEIAYRCGFANPNHFSRVFKSHHDGVPPAQYRRKSWSGNSERTH